MEPLNRPSIWDLIAKVFGRPAVVPQSKHRNQRRPKSRVYRDPYVQRHLNSGRKHWKRWAKRQARKDRRVRRVA